MRGIGTNISASSMKNLVMNWSNEQGENIWKKTYKENLVPLVNQAQSSNLMYDASLRNIKTDYTNVINQAYDAYVANRRAIDFSDFGTGDKYNVNQSYAKAYDEARKQYQNDYKAAVSKLESERQATLANYADSVTQFATAIDEEQNNIAQNYANFFNSFYDYLNSVYEQYQYTDIFGEGSPFAEYVIRDDEGNPISLMSSSDILNTMSVENKDGTVTLNESALDYLRRVAGMRDYFSAIDKTYTTLPSFQEYLYNEKPELETFRQQYGEQFYRDLGIEKGSLDVYDVGDTFSNYKPVDTYSNIDATVNWKGSDVKLNINDTDFNFKRGDIITNNVLIKALNTQSSGKGDKTPKNDTVQIYNGKIYIYDDTGNDKGWGQLTGNSTDIDNFIKQYRKN